MATPKTGQLVFSPDPVTFKNWTLGNVTAEWGFAFTPAMVTADNAIDLAAQALDYQLAALSHNDLLGILDNTFDTQDFLDQLLGVADQILNTLQASGGGVDLTPVTSWLQQIDASVQALAQVGGGAPIDFTDVALALNAIDYDLAQTLNSQIYSAGVRTSEAVASFLTPTVEQFDRNLTTILTQIYLQLAAQGAAGAPGDPNVLSAGEYIGDSSDSAALLGSIMNLLAAREGKFDVDAFHDDIAAEGQLSRLALNPEMWAELTPILKGVLKGAKAAGWLIVGDQVLNQGRMTGGVVDPLAHWFSEGWQSAQKIVKPALNAALKASEELSDPLHRLFDPVFAKMLDAVHGKVNEIGEVSPAQGFSTARSMLTEAAVQGMHASHISTIFEMVPFFKHFGVHQVSALMADMAAFGPIAAQTWGRAIGEGVGRPAGYEMNAMMRSRLFDEFTLAEAFARRLLSAQDFATGMAFHGYPDALIPVLQENAFRRPTVRDITWAIMDASVDESAITTLLQDAGHRDSTVAALAPALAMQRTKTQRQALLSEVESNLENGFLSEADARYYFDSLQLPLDAQGMIITKAKLALRAKLINDHITALKTQYKNNLIDESEFRLALGLNGVVQERIDAEVAIVASQIAGKVAAAVATEEKAAVRKVQTALQEELRAQYENGFLDAPAYELALIQAGIDAAVARATVAMEEYKLAGRAGKAREVQAVRLTHEIVTARTASFVELFQKSMISSSQLGQFLLDLGLDPKLAQAIVAREVARAAPTVADLQKLPAALKAKELFTIAKATLTAKFQKGQIDSNDFYAGLVKIGVDPSIAQATVGLEISKRATEKYPPSDVTIDPQVVASQRRAITAGIDAFVAGKITRDALALLLKGFGATDEVLNALLAEAIEKQALKSATPAGAA